MELSQDQARIYVPDGSEPSAAFQRTTHLGIGAHPDDLESIAIPGILACFADPRAWFSGVTVTTGAGAPRAEIHQELSADAYAALRAEEQIQAAEIGKYSAIALLGYPSPAARDFSNEDLRKDLSQVMTAGHPEVVYTHNPFDRHPTHRAVCFQVLGAIRQLSGTLRPERLIGMEFWGSLDWVPEPDRLQFDTSADRDLQRALLEAFSSQNILKAYPDALLGRRKANAVLDQSHQGDRTGGQIFGLDLTPLIQNDQLEPERYLAEILNKFQALMLKNSGF